MAKERRQRILAIGGVVLLGLLLAYEVPHTLHLVNKSSSSSSSSAPPVPVISVSTPTASAVKTSAAYRRAVRQAPHDVFHHGNAAGEATTLGSVATPPRLHDPFASPSSPGAAVAPVAPVAKPRVPTLPGTIIIGTPGPGKVTVQGWIVILASIPTAQGQSSATSFATQAQKAGVGTVKVLNSSNRRPLRGGYWVVYTGPFTSLAAVSTAASSVHAKGFATAYIRQLIVYKQAPTKKTSKKKTTKK